MPTTTDPTPIPPTVYEQRHGTLSTLNEDGSRRWLNPRPSRGRFWTRRRAVAYTLIALFTAIPYITVNGLPLVLLDIVHRRFTLFGYTFLPTDTPLFVLLMVAVFLAVFLATSVLGRVWCGWACPQTVYMEFLYRPIERLFEGEPGRSKQPTGGLKRVLKWAVYILASLFIAHTFLAYFVGIDQLKTWVTRSPFEHPTAFLLMAGVTAAMLFDFGFFREQMCTIACPYGRFQSVMLDRGSLIVAYDRKRGEPRGKAKRVSLPVLDAAPQGDCVDCRMCVTTCPTGIDIRDGLQMECIHCTQCIDACDAVMTKVGRPTGLIRYSSQRALEGEPRKARPRVVIYSALLALITSIFTHGIITKPPVDINLLRGRGMPFNELPSGLISNQLRVKVTNRLMEQATCTVSLINAPAGGRIEIESSPNPFTVAPGEQTTIAVIVLLPREVFVPSGTFDARIAIETADGYRTEHTYRLLGPMNNRVRRDAPKEPSRG
ncbi:MAG TPA: cytochrome c oxidase accessory protein CcoG [Phycisphaerales bacterium]|nr:cytochrome c oxidase accessory protein CcoG [Phycisphaerales bacterium]